MGAGILEWLYVRMDRISAPLSSLVTGVRDVGNDNEATEDVAVGGGEDDKPSRKKQRNRSKRRLQLHLEEEWGKKEGQQKALPPRPLCWAYPPSLESFFTEQVLVEAEPTDEVLFHCLEWTAKLFALSDPGKGGVSAVMLWEQHREKVGPMAV